MIQIIKKYLRDDYHIKIQNKILWDCWKTIYGNSKEEINAENIKNKNKFYALKQPIVNNFHYKNPWKEIYLSYIDNWIMQLLNDHSACIELFKKNVIYINFWELYDDVDLCPLIHAYFMWRHHWEEGDISLVSFAIPNNPEISKTIDCFWEEAWLNEQIFYLELEGTFQWALEVSIDMHLARKFFFTDLGQSLEMVPYWEAFRNSPESPWIFWFISPQNNKPIRTLHLGTDHFQGTKSGFAKIISLFCKQIRGVHPRG